VEIIRCFKTGKFGDEMRTLQGSYHRAVKHLFSHSRQTGRRLPLIGDRITGNPFSGKVDCGQLFHLSLFHIVS
jgi:hypothetical protein